MTLNGLASAQTCAGAARGSSRWPAHAACLAVAVALLLASSSPSRAQTDRPTSPPHGQTEQSLKEVVRQINNPIPSLWQVTFDNQIAGLSGGGLDSVEPGYVGTFQPLMPVSLSKFGLGRFGWTKHYNVITRLTVPFIETMPLSPGPAGSERESGFGDVQLASVLAPNNSFMFLWGVGPTFIFPSATDQALGQGKWQAGPVAVMAYLTTDWTAYTIAQQWWSFAGDDDRAGTSQLCVNYVLLRNLPHHWQVGMQPSASVDWTASRGNKVSFPVGLGFGKTVGIGKTAGAVLGGA